MKVANLVLAELICAEVFISAFINQLLSKIKHLLLDHHTHTSHNPNLTYLYLVSCIHTTNAHPLSDFHLHTVRSTKIDLLYFRHADPSQMFYIHDSIMIYLAADLLRYSFSILGACRNCKASIEYILLSPRYST